MEIQLRHKTRKSEWTVRGNAQNYDSLKENGALPPLAFQAGDVVRRLL